TEIKVGGTPALSAASSSVSPKVSQPAPSLVSTARVASVGLALIEGRSRALPSGHPAASAVPRRRTFDRSRVSDMTYSGVPKRAASSVHASYSTYLRPSRTLHADPSLPPRSSPRQD